MGAIANKSSVDASLIESVVIAGDLSKLTPQQRTDYYGNVCKSLGLNPLTKPFDYIQLNGKLTLYAKRDATDQLRSKHKISITISSRDKIDDVYIVTAKAKNSDGREDESTGAVSVGNLKGEALANAMMKAETKAKRRVTLSICGLGILDESEVESIDASAKTAAIPAPKPKAAEVADQPPGEYVATFGKYKGQRLADIDVADLANYVAYIEQKAEEDQKPIKGQVLSFVMNAMKLVAERQEEFEDETV